MATSKKKSIDFGKWSGEVSSQFQNLDTKDPSSWPLIPKVLLCLLIAGGATVAAWYGYLNSFEEELERERNTEVTLRADYEKKLQKAVSLEGLKKQREQVQQYVLQLEKQLPSKSEMSALLSDINQAGLGRSLTFEMFKPGSVVVQNYYAELPISIRVSGQYHDIGAFASDVAHLSRIVTLSNISISPKSADGPLIMNATAHTYRYLDTEEVNAQRNAAKPKKGGKK